MASYTCAMYAVLRRQSLCCKFCADFLNLERSQSYACDLEHETQSSSQQCVNIRSCMLVCERANAEAEAVTAISYLSCFPKCCDRTWCNLVACNPGCQNVRPPAPYGSKQYTHSDCVWQMVRHAVARWSHYVHTVMHTAFISTVQ